MKKLIASFLICGVLEVQAQDPAIAGIDVFAKSITVGQTTQITADFLNGSSTDFNVANQVQWLINTPPCIEIVGPFEFDDPLAANFVNITFTPYDPIDGQILFITSKPGVPFPGGAAYNIEFDVIGKFVAANQPFSIQAESTPAVGTNAPGNDNVANTLSVTAVLPLKLLDFGVKKVGNSSQLSWNIADLGRASEFGIERSADGKNWKKIGQVAATTRLSYDFNDNAPLSKANYYRLAQKDVDGTLSYSPIRLLNFGTSRAIALFPNPVNKLVTVTGLSASDKVELIDGTGRRLFGVDTGGANTKQVDMTRLAGGYYLLRVISIEGDVTTLPVLKN